MFQIGDVCVCVCVPLQSFYISVIIHVPHFDRAIMRGAVQVVCSSPERQTLVI